MFLGLNSKVFGTLIGGWVQWPWLSVVMSLTPDLKLFISFGSRKASGRCPFAPVLETSRISALQLSNMPVSFLYNRPFQPHIVWVTFGSRFLSSKLSESLAAPWVNTLTLKSAPWATSISLAGTNLIFPPVWSQTSGRYSTHSQLLINIIGKIVQFFGVHQTPSRLTLCALSSGAWGLESDCESGSPEKWWRYN